MKIIESKNYLKMSHTACQILAEQIGQNPKIKLGLATGSTPIGLYNRLIHLNKKKEISFQKVTTFNLDEYVGLPATHPNSYHYFMRENFFQHIDINEANTHIPNGMAYDLEKECIRYQQVIETAGGMDIQVLGLGENGHIGFNEPGTSFSEETHIISLEKSTREANARFFDNIDQVPKKAITVGINTIMQSKQVILLISGETKAEAYNRLVNGGITETFPASILQKHKNCIVLVDQETTFQITN
ncbi:glucosamine-6-phosphate deaminase [Gracilibacillus xinjiangensis]|uniref:Glucosamine-6-phosphate deaminase n=1 Tax=Gracilibacillus xinjiangensis TaxID=1193282 RepID=A0ABV8WUA8_9BACI